MGRRGHTSLPLPIFFFLFYAAYRNKLSKVCWHPFPRSRVPPVRGDQDTDLRLSLLVLDGGVRDFYSRVYLARSALKKARHSEKHFFIESVCKTVLHQSDQMWPIV